jgi:hypothetical protein
MTTELTADQLKTAEKYLRSAADALACYGNAAPEAILAAKVYAALAYYEGDAEKLIEAIRENRAAPSGE